ncbi:hypothetical protein OAI07_00930 [Akkermansiaceae bacterium]|nr:hypothetical protein [Akkermansiaceae bacterium]
MVKYLYTLVSCIFVLSGGVSMANTPYWWGEYGVLPKESSASTAIASVSHLKHLVEKTDLYFKKSYSSGSGRVSAIMQESWFTDTSNNGEALTAGLLRYVGTVIYDKIAIENPPEIRGNGVDVSLNTKWMADASPFHQAKYLLSGGDVKTPINSDGVIYPWSPQFAKSADKSLVTMGRLRFTFTFELESSRDKSRWVTVVPEGQPFQEYKLYKPSDANRGKGKLPLVVDLTGDGGYSGDSTRFARHGQYRAYVLAFKHANNTNIDFIIQKIEELISGESVDKKRIYVKGYSRGGVALMDLLHRRPDLVTVAWFVDPGISQLGLHDNPFRERTWTANNATSEQVVFAKKLKSNQVHVILSPAQANRGGGALWSQQEMREFYRLFSKYGVDVKYSILPGNHGSSNAYAVYDFRYWSYMFQLSKH